MKHKEETGKFENLTDDEIMEWAGYNIFKRGENYFHKECVDGIEVYPDGSFVAEVNGSEIYEVLIYFRGNKIVSECSCPYENSPCKHAVSAVLKYREDLREGNEIEEIDFDERNPGGSRLQKDLDGSDFVRFYLETLNKEELIELIEDIARKYREIALKLKQAGQIKSGNMDKVVKAAKKKIKKLTSEQVYVDHWSGDGNIPDYSSLHIELMQILDSGHSDEIVELGEELFEESKQQLEECGDEGEMQSAIELCMEVFFMALGRSSLSTAEQIKKIFEMLDDDDMGVIYNSAQTYFEGDFRPEKWNEISYLLCTEFENSKEDSLSYRNILIKWIEISFDRAGMENRVIPFLKSCAKNFDDCERLADRLIKENRLDEAVDFIFECLGKKQNNTDIYYHDSSDRLRMKLAEVYVKKENTHSIASVYADFFFRNPTFESYKKMIEISEKISLGEKVREYTVNYIKTGEIPFNKAGWPLPEIGLSKYFTSSSRGAFPKLDILIKISFLEKKYDEALNYFDEMRGDYHSYWLEEEIADAVKETHPDRSVKIWKNKAKSEIDKTSRNHYENAYGYLVKIKKVLKKQGIESEWEKYINNLRIENKRKPAFIETVKNL